MPTLRPWAMVARAGRIEPVGSQPTHQGPAHHDRRHRRLRNSAAPGLAGKTAASVFVAFSATMTDRRRSAGGPRRALPWARRPGHDGGRPLGRSTSRRSSRSAASAGHRPPRSPPAGLTDPPDARRRPRRILRQASGDKTVGGIGGLRGGHHGPPGCSRTSCSCTCSGPSPPSGPRSRSRSIGSMGGTSAARELRDARLGHHQRPAGRPPGHPPGRDRRAPDLDQWPRPAGPRGRAGWSWPSSCTSSRSASRCSSRSATSSASSS